MNAVKNKPRLRAVKDGEPVLRSVEIALRRENHDAWDLADAIYDDVLDLMPEQVATRPVVSGVNTGIRVAQDRVYQAHSDAGTEVGKFYVRQMFDTVRVWPVEERRTDLASFVVHSELRGQDFRNRRQIIERLAGKSRTGRVTWTDLRRWKSERKPAHFRSFLELAEKRIRRAVHDAGKPWHLVVEEDREAIARVLRDIAAEVEAGEFV